MSDTKYIDKVLSEICDFISEDRALTNDYIDKHKGKYPVYSATLGKPFGYIDTYKQTEKILAVVNYGNSGNTYIMPEGNYNIGRNICGLKIKDIYANSVSLEYLKIIATPIFIKTANGDKYKSLSQTVIKKIVVSIPVKDDNTFDLDVQLKLVKKYKEIKEKQEILLADKKKLLETKIDIDLSNYEYVYKPIIEIFEIERGKSTYTKAFCIENIGEYPVYSANNTEIFGKIKFFDYDGRYLTLSVNGIAGVITIKDEKFSCNGDRAVLIPKRNDINIDYIKYIAQPIFRQNARGRRGINGENEFTKLSKEVLNSLVIPIPVKEDGTFDLDVQKEIADKYKRIEDIKMILCKQIDNVLEIGIEM